MSLWRAVVLCLLLPASAIVAAPAAADIASVPLAVPDAGGARMVDVAAEPLGSSLVAWYEPASRALRLAERKGARWRTASIELEAPPVGLSAWYAADGPGIAYADPGGVWIARRSQGWRPVLVVAGEAAAVDAAVLADGELLVVAALREADGARLLAFRGKDSQVQRDLGPVTAATPVAVARFRAGSAVAYAAPDGELVVVTDDGTRRHVHRLQTRAGAVRLAADATGRVAAIYAGLPPGPGTRSLVGVARFGARGGGARWSIERDLPCRGRPRPVAIGYVATDLRVGYLVCSGDWRLAHGDGRLATVTPPGRLVGTLRASATIAGRIVLVGEREGSLQLQWLRP